MTFQDIKNQLQDVIDSLDSFHGSEQIDVEHMQQQLEDIIEQLTEVEINDDEDDFKTFNEAPYGDD
jgi:hypothetical protein